QCSYPCHAAHQHLHSFPTRRSSDLMIEMRRRGHAATQDSSPTIREGADADSRQGAEPQSDAKIESREIKLAIVGRPNVGKSSLRSEEHTSELQSRENLVCRLLLEKK